MSRVQEKQLLINILLGLLKPDEGKILVDGNELKNSQIAHTDQKLNMVVSIYL